MKGKRGIFMAMCLGACCLLGTMGAEAKVKVKSVKLKSNYGKIVHVGKGKKVKVTATVKVKPNKSSNKGVKYKSKNKRIAKINSIGQVKGLKIGTTRVYAISKKNKKKRASIQVKVVKPMKKIKFRQKSKTIKVGESFKVKRTLVPSDSGFKKLKWTSSIPSVAKVDSTGKVKGLKAGKVTIKAKAVDGSGKSASCTVKVEAKDTVNIVSAQALSENTVRVSFDKEISLDKSKFRLSGKTSATAKFNKTLKIRSVRNYENQSYDLRLADGYSIERNSFFRVSVNELPGNGTKVFESQALLICEESPENIYATVETGEYIEPIVVDLSEYGCGSLSYEVGSVPKGINYRVVNNQIVFTGKPEGTHFGKTTVISATDELEKKVQTNVYWYVGSQTTIVGYAKDMRLVAGQEINKEIGRRLNLSGGSGKYVYEFRGLPDGMQGDEKNGVLSGKAQKNGEYTVTITVMDAEDTSIKANIQFKVFVETGFNISGVVCDAQGWRVPGVTITFESREKETSYTTITDANGYYSIQAVEGVYDGVAALNQKDVILDDIFQYEVKSNAQIDFGLECFRVKLNYDNEMYQPMTKSWYSQAESGVVYEGESVIYVRPGIYNIYTPAYRKSSEEEMQECVLRAQFTVNSSGIATNVTVSEMEKEEENKDAE